MPARPPERLAATTEVFIRRVACAVAVAAVLAGYLLVAAPADAGWGCMPAYDASCSTNPPPAAALYAEGQTLYALTASGSTVSVIDAGTGATTATIGIGSKPDALAGAPGCGTLYAANDGTGTTSSTSGTISAIDLASNTVTATFATGGSPYAIALSPSCGVLYVGDVNADAVSVIDTATGAVTATIPVGDYPGAVAVSPDGSRVFVANLISGTVSVIDTASDTVTATFAVGSSPDALAVSPDGSTLYVANSGSGEVAVIDLATNTLTATIPVGSSPDALAIPAAGVLLVGNGAGSSVSVVAMATASVTQTVSVNSMPVALAASAESGTIFSLDGSGTLSRATFGWTSDPTITLPGSETIPNVGDTLTASPGTWIPAVVSYQWNAGGQPIAGATSSTLTVSAAQAGEPITVTVSNAAGSATSAPTADVSGPTQSAPTTATTPTATTPAPKTKPNPRRRPPQHLSVRISGPKGGATYFGHPPEPRCITHTNLGSAHCRITRQVTHTPDGSTITYTAHATGSAGTHATATLRINTAELRIAGLRARHGIYIVRLGNTYTLSVASRIKPLYVDAAVAPQPPAGTHDWFKRAGAARGTPVWRLRVYLPQALSAFAIWNIGVRIGGRLDILQIRT